MQFEFVLQMLFCVKEAKLDHGHLYKQFFFLKTLSNVKITSLIGTS